MKSNFNPKVYKFFFVCFGQWYTNRGGAGAGPGPRGPGGLCIQTSSDKICSDSKSLKGVLLSEQAGYRDPSVLPNFGFTSFLDSRCYAWVCYIMKNTIKWPCLLAINGKTYAFTKENVWWNRPLVSYLVTAFVCPINPFEGWILDGP